MTTFIFQRECRKHNLLLYGDLMVQFNNNYIQFVLITPKTLDLGASYEQSNLC